MSSKTLVSALLIWTVMGAASTVAVAQTTDGANVLFLFTLFPFTLPICGIGFAMFAPLTVVGVVGMRRRYRRLRGTR